MFMQDWVSLCFSAVGSACIPSQAKLPLTQLFLSLFISAILAFLLVNVPFAFTNCTYFKAGSYLPCTWACEREVMLVVVPEPGGRGQLVTL